MASGQLLRLRRAGRFQQREKLGGLMVLEWQSAADNLKLLAPVAAGDHGLGPGQ
ncbi:hypothetical protein OG394_13055 [Kribbella sp. NBC_01245]|uniref:hypothetical protein n=1 Tax=Kribbella sp. NBC_01245 TaxID=2903578 RepID=UPI002E280BA5|nr:hypothetical protein [Kribbella sp. NBC_01245]